MEIHEPSRPIRPLVRRTLSISLASLCLTVPVPSGAQDVVVIRSPDRCDRCLGISWEPLASLGSLDDPVSPGPASWVAFDGERFLVAPLEGAEGEFAIYSRDGLLLETRGRRGEGPDEFQGIRQVGYAGGLWHVVMGHRVTYLDSSFSTVATAPLRTRPDRILALPDTTTVVNGWMYTSDGAGRPLHIIRGSSGVAQSFGPERGAALVDETEARRFFHVVGPASDPRSFWTSPAFDYTPERWTVDGRRTATIEVDADWFEPRPDVHDPFAYRPGTILTGIREDEDGLLWIAIAVAAEGWRPQPTPPGWEGPVRVREVFDTRLEVLSLPERRVIARTRVPGLVAAASGEGLFVRYRTGRWDDTVLEVLRVSIDSTEVNVK